MADDLDMSPLATEIILQALRPVVVETSTEYSGLINGFRFVEDLLE